MNKLFKFFVPFLTAVLFCKSLTACETSFFIQHVTADDKLNSRGTPLTDAAAYLQQDRYWFHAKSRRDFLDGSDYIATTKEARAWFGKAVREHIGPDSEYVMQQGDFVAVISYDQCSVVNASGERDYPIFINYVDVSPLEGRGYVPSLRYVDAERASEITGFDELQSSQLERSVFEAFATAQSIQVRPENALVAYLPRVELFLLQAGSCSNVLCPFALSDRNGQQVAKFDAEYGLAYAEGDQSKMLVNRNGAVLVRFPKGIDEK